MKRGQLEISFQWIFVLIAGGAFLILFFILLKGCSQAGLNQQAGLGGAAAATKLQSLAWQGDTRANITLAAATVSCPAGTIALVSENSISPISRTPIFLPPRVDGKLQVLTQQIALGEDSRTPLPLGNILYGLDERFVYLVAEDADGTYTRIADPLAGTRGLVVLGADEFTNPTLASHVPAGTTTVVLVSASAGLDLVNADVTQILPNVRVLGVALLPTTSRAGILAFYERHGAKLERTGGASYETPELALGAVVSGTETLYRCGRTPVAQRMRHITQIYHDRSAALLADATNLPVDSVNSCSRGLEEGERIFGETNALNDEGYLAALFGNETRLIAVQESLLGQSCPVIG